jgi:Carboxypeptidase regulatory-like domain
MKIRSFFCMASNCHFRVLAISALVLAGGLSNAAWAVDPMCDATTGASHRIMGITTTTTSATIAWREGHTNGDRYYCIGTTTADKCAKAQSRAGGLKNEVFSGLTANTLYKYRAYGVWGGNKSIVTGTFTTNGTGCWMVTTAEIKGVATTEAKVPLENVEVKVVHNNTKAVVGMDTTDEKGNFSILVKDEANLTTSFSYPPFTSPGSQSNWIQIQTTKTLSNLVFKGAYQVGGTILSANGKDSLPGVTVKVTNASDGALLQTRTTNAKGHFNFGLKPGNYLVAASYNGINSTPIPLNVSKDAEMPVISIAATVGVYRNKLIKTKRNPSAKSLEYRANGAVINTPSTFKVDAFQRN